MKKNKAQHRMLRSFNKRVGTSTSLFSIINIKRSQNTHHKEDRNKLNGFKIFYIQVEPMFNICLYSDKMGKIGSIMKFSNI